MANSKGGIISVTVNGETFKCDGFTFNRDKVTVPGDALEAREVSMSGTIEGTLTATAEEMEAHMKAWEPIVWRMRWSMMWRIVGALAYHDLSEQEALCNNEGPPDHWKLFWPVDGTE